MNNILTSRNPFQIIKSIIITFSVFVIWFVIVWWRAYKSSKNQPVNIFVKWARIKTNTKITALSSIRFKDSAFSSPNFPKTFYSSKIAYFVKVLKTFDCFPLFGESINWIRHVSPFFSKMTCLGVLFGCNRQHARYYFASVLSASIFAASSYGANPSFGDTYGTNGMRTAVTGTGGNQKIAIGFNGSGAFLPNAAGFLSDNGSGLLSWVTIIGTNLIAFNAADFYTNGANVVNLLNRSIWTNDNGDVYTLPVDATNVLVEQFEVFGAAKMDGRFGFGSTSQNLVLGQNDIDTLTTADKALVSPTNNASLVTIRLSGPSDAQLLFLENGNTNTAWTLKAGQTNSDIGQVFLQGGDFVTGGGTNLVLMLKGSGNDWQEVRRFEPGNTNGSSVVINPTRGFVPFKVDNTTFGDSSFVTPSFGTMILTNTNSAIATLIIAGTNSLGKVTLTTTTAGTTITASGGLGLASASGSSFSFSEGANRINFLSAFFYPNTSNSIIGGQSSLPFKDWFSKIYSLVGTDGSTNQYTDNGANLLRNGVPILAGGGTINPTDGRVPVRGNSTTFTNSILLQTNGSIITALGSVRSLAYQFTNGYDFTNSSAANSRVELLQRGGTGGSLHIGGTAGGIDISGNLSSSITAQQNLDIIHNGYDWKFTDDGFFGIFRPGASNAQDIGTASFPVRSLYVSGTNSIHFIAPGINSDLTANATTLFLNGVPVGNWIVSGSTISPIDSVDTIRLIRTTPTQLRTATDDGATSGVISADTALTSAELYIQYTGSNGLTSGFDFRAFDDGASNGIPSGSMYSNGTNLMTFNADGSMTFLGNLLNFGAFAGQSQEIDGSVDVLNLSRLSGVQQMITNSQGIISMGIGSGFLRTVIDSTNIVGIGADSFELSYMTNVNDFLAFGQGGDTTFAYDSQRIIAIGHESLGDAILHNANNLLFANCFVGAHAELSDSGNFDVIGNQAAQYYAATNTTDVLALGSLAADHGISDNSSDLSYIGKQAGSLSALTNSTSVMFLNGLAGGSVFGTYSNVVFVGSGSTATSGASDKVILGPTMSIRTGNSGSGVADWLLGKIVTGATVVLTTTNYVEVKINGVVRKLALVQ